MTVAPTRTPNRVRSALDLARALDLPPPTDEQQAIVESPPDRPLLVVAGAGSGKTETMAARVVWLVANGHVEPDQVLGLTFTRKAATELAERIGRRLRRLTHTGVWVPRALDEDGAEPLGGIPVVSTYHSYAGRLVREHALRLGYEPESQLLSQAAAWQLAQEVVSRYDGDVGELESAESTVTAAVVSLAGELAEHLLTPDDVRRFIDEFSAAVEATPRGSTRRRVHPLTETLGKLRNRRAILPMVERFLVLKRDRDVLDFGDQIALAARLAEEFPAIGAGERGRFRAVLLDEFQDTSEAQLVMLRALFASGGISGTGGTGGIGVTAVGDPNQSIYGWRGASATTLVRFPTEFPDGASRARVLPLRTSWRNDEAILAVANTTAEPLRSEMVPPLRARPDAAPGRVRVARLETDEDEAGYVADWVAQRWWSPSGRRTGASAAVLCRKRAQFVAVAAALTARGLPVEVVGLGGLLVTPEVGDLVSLLWVVQDPSRGDRLMRLLTGPFCRLGPADLDGLASWARASQRSGPSLPGEPTSAVLPGLEGPLDDAFEQAGDVDTLSRGGDESGLARTPEPGEIRDQAPESSDRASMVEALDHLPPPDWRGAEGQYVSAAARERLVALATEVRALRRMTGMPLAELVGEGERRLGLDVEVLARPEHTVASGRAHLDAFAEVAARFSATADRPTLGGFLAWIDAALAEENGLDTPTVETTVDAVRILTVHAAKGLEWDCVAVPGLLEGAFPNREGGVSSTWSGGEWTVTDRTDKGWCSGADGVPYDLRGDRDGLPHLRWQGLPDWETAFAEFTSFCRAGGEHAVAEERRLAYVAFTRARRELLVTASVWTDAKTPRVTSVFLDELLAVPGLLERGPWVDLPDGDDDPVNPRLGAPVPHPWPDDPMADRRAEIGGAVDLVGRAISAERAVASPDDPTAPRLDDVTERELELLLAERAAARSSGDTSVELPRHLSASALVQLAGDAERFTLALRRPLPAAPALAARRGTAFHAWVEQHYARAAFVDVTDLPGSADETAPDSVSGAELDRMKALFLDSEWAQRIPEAVEVAVETVLDGFALRGRIDAVFPTNDGGVTIVDWKTGAEPTGAQARQRALQLGAYALAYARLRGLPPAKVGAAFYYAQSGRTVRPRIPARRALESLLRSVPD